MRFRVITAAYDVRQYPPEPVEFSGDHAISPRMGEEIIDTVMNPLFSKCETVWDVEDAVLNFWNRLNPSDKCAPNFTSSPSEKVVVIDVRPAHRLDRTGP